MIAASGPLLGRTVVVCRPERDAAPLIERLEALAASVVAMPLLARAPAADGGRALAQALTHLDRYRWLVVTSANGARAVLEALGGKALPPNLGVAAVGPATAEALTGAGVPVDLVPETATAADLAASFDPSPSGERVLAALAEAASDDLVDGLAERGYGVDRVDAYRMELRPVDPGRLAEVGGADAVLLTSPSTADGFAASVPVEARPRVTVCIGPTTSRRAIELGLPGVVVARSHDGDGLVDALLDVLPTTIRRQ